MSENKFERICIEELFSFKKKELDKLIYWCEEFNEKGLTPPFINYRGMQGDGASLGNLSFRSKKNKFIITASRIKEKKGLGLEHFCEAINVLFSENSNNLIIYKGKRKPSLETPIHHLLYQKYPFINAVFHGHNDYITNNYKELGLFCTEKYLPEGSKDLAYSVIDLIENIRYKKTLKKNMIIILKEHGFISFGTSMDKAGELALKYVN
jgi:ribulose-5-phosphate 4-epimerase/fuculose-1-phosphate aldolase